MEILVFKIERPISNNKENKMFATPLTKKVFLNLLIIIEILIFMFAKSGLQSRSLISHIRNDRKRSCRQKSASKVYKAIIDRAYFLQNTKKNRRGVYLTPPPRRAGNRIKFSKTIGTFCVFVFLNL